MLRGATPGPLLTWSGMGKEWEGRVKGFLLLKKGREERTGEGKREGSRGGEGPAAGVLLHGLRGYAPDRG